MEIPEICRYCGGVVRLVPAETVYGESAERLKMENEWIYQCQNCNARVGCHKGTKRPLGNVANEMLRLKRMETHRILCHSNAVCIYSGTVFCGNSCLGKLYVIGVHH